MENPIRDPRTLVEPATSKEALDALDHAHRQIIASEVAALVALTRAADLWQVDETAVGEGIERLMQPGHDGTPLVGEFLALEIGPLLGISPQSAIFQIGDALYLRHRHPRLWQAVLAGTERVWQAKKARVMKALAGQVIAADPDLARQRAEARRDSRKVRVSKIEDGHVSFYGLVNPVDGILFDHVLTQIAETLPTAPDTPLCRDLDRRRAAAIGVLARGALGQDTLPTHTLVVHISADNLGIATGVARIEDWGPILTDQLPQFLAHSKVVVRPILDPAAIRPVDAYETPARMRFAVEQRNPVDVFPWGTRKASRCDMDHTIAYIEGRPGQTSLGPLSRKTHRVKTHGRWTLEQPEPGAFHWTSPYGYQYYVTAAGTTRLFAPAGSG